VVSVHDIVMDWSEYTVTIIAYSRLQLLVDYLCDTVKMLFNCPFDGVKLELQRSVKSSVCTSS
jgi:hypothetical protein